MTRATPMYGTFSMLPCDIINKKRMQELYTGCTLRLNGFFSLSPHLGLPPKLTNSISVKKLICCPISPTITTRFSISDSCFIQKHMFTQSVPSHPLSTPHPSGRVPWRHGPAWHPAHAAQRAARRAVGGARPGGGATCHGERRSRGGAGTHGGARGMGHPTWDLGWLGTSKHSARKSCWCLVGNWGMIHKNYQ